MPGHPGGADTRAREYGNVVLSPHHGLICEIVIEISMLASAIMFILGSLCFFSGLPFQVLEIGELLFIVASIVYVVIGAMEMLEMCHSNTEGRAAIMRSSAFHEQMAYLVSAIIFAVGTVLYWPGIYGSNKDAEKLGIMIAAWMFVVGSLGFVIASFWNAIQLSEHPEDAEHGKLWNRLTKMSLFFSIMGGVFFVTGSYLFSLDVEEGCNKNVPEQMAINKTTGQKASSGVFCVGVLDQGSLLFVIGSIFYTMASILNCIKLCLRRFIKIDKHGYCGVGMNDDMESERLSTGREELDARDQELKGAE